MSESSLVLTSLPERQGPAEVLQGLVDAAILHAPHLDWHAVDLQVIRYLIGSHQSTSLVI